MAFLDSINQDKIMTSFNTPFVQFSTTSTLKYLPLLNAAINYGGEIKKNISKVKEYLVVLLTI